MRCWNVSKWWTMEFSKTVSSHLKIDLLSWEVLFLIFARLDNSANVDILLSGCQEFFLRHTLSGKCISAEHLFRDNKAGKRYWAEMVQDCLHKNASFRYLQSKLVHNIATGGSLVTSSSHLYEGRLFIQEGKSQRGKKFENSNTHRLKQTNAGALFFYHGKINSCVEPDAKTQYINQKKNGCSDTAGQRFTFGKTSFFIDEQNGLIITKLCVYIQLNNYMSSLKAHVVVKHNFKQRYFSTFTLVSPQVTKIDDLLLLCQFYAMRCLYNFDLMARFHGCLFLAKCEIFHSFLLNCDCSTILFLLDCSQFKRGKRYISHFAEKFCSLNQAFMWASVADSALVKINYCGKLSIQSTGNVLYIHTYIHRLYLKTR